MTFSANVNFGNRGNSILRVDLYQCFDTTTVSGVTTCTNCLSGPLPGYNDVSWLDFNNGGLIVTGLTTTHPQTGLYTTTTYIKMVGIPAQGASCDVEDCFAIVGIPTPTPTPSPTPSADCTFSGGSIVWTPDCTFSGGSIVYSV